MVDQMLLVPPQHLLSLFLLQERDQIGPVEILDINIPYAELAAIGIGQGFRAGKADNLPVDVLLVAPVDRVAIVLAGCGAPKH